MNTLVIDAGNTRIKAARFIDDTMMDRLESEDVGQIMEWANQSAINYAILSETGEPNNQLHTLVHQYSGGLILDAATPLPFVNQYASPDTLGADRKALVAGATALFPATNCLVIDLGTCITYDYVDAGSVYHGGSISPGAAMRLRAMHEFTGRLPLAPLLPFEMLTGNTTETALQSGVIQGITGEINHMIQRYSEVHGTIQVILCGGDAALFGKHLKSSIFAAPQLVLSGLNQILRFNVSEGL